MLLSFNAKRKVYKTFKSRSLHPSVGQVSKLVRSFTSILGLLPLLPTLSLLIGLQLFSSPVPHFKLMALIIREPVKNYLVDFFRKGGGWRFLAKNSCFLADFFLSGMPSLTDNQTLCSKPLSGQKSLTRKIR